MIELKDFQQRASATIADRFSRYVVDPVVTGTAKQPRHVPFFQALASITASGKTVVLADSVATISGMFPVPPIVMWLSKGKVVVAQTLANLLPGGKYHHLLGNADVRPLAEHDAREVAEAARPLLFFATVGTFNQKDKEQGQRVIYRCDIDTADQSTWDGLKDRRTSADTRRPLLVVYDEAQNLTDQQTDLLMELEPDGFLLASATMRLPSRLSQDVAKLKAGGWDDDDLVTVVDAAAVAESGLVKNTLALGGYQSPMEETVTAMLRDFEQADKDARKYGLEGKPKAIYVSNTNIVSGNANQRDDPKQPFTARQAPPILIWRHLVEHHGIDPHEIAVYCSLDFQRNYPPPEGFHLFKGGDKDYDSFVSGSFRHIIFNVSLQEGWDDPLCYFAYVDKSMDSRVQVEQLIGRLLRQPGTRHYSAARLNTAHFYVRVDRNKVFTDMLAAVGKKLRSDAPDIKLVASPPGKPAPTEFPPRQDVTVPGTALDTSEAVEPVARLIGQLSDYRHDDGTNTRGIGSRAIVEQRVGEGGTIDPTWETFEQSTRVLARWIFNREIRKRHPGALGVAPTSDPKFDAPIGLGSNAEAHVVSVAEHVVDAFLENVDITQRLRDPYAVGPMLARPDEIKPFKHSVHEGYDGLNSFEEHFAEALDKRKLPWFRNPSRTGYGIPLPSLGPTKNFYPDFILWADDDVFAIDTKGGHLLPEAVMRKVLWIEAPRRATTRLFVRLVSEGTWNTAAQLETSDGYTLWGMKSGGTRTVRHMDSLDDVVQAAMNPRRG